MHLEINIDDRLIDHVRRLLCKRNLVLLGVLVTLTSTVVFAELPNPAFMEGEVISSTAVNQNFRDLDTRLTKIENEMNTLTTGNHVVNGEVIIVVEDGGGCSLTVVHDDTGSGGCPDGWTSLGSDIHSDESAVSYLCMSCVPPR